MPHNDASLVAAPVSRRRFIAIAGCAVGAAMLPGRTAAAVPLHRWRGVALGADASIQLAHPDAATAERLIAACVAEVRRLERIFSLYDDNSTLTRLNREGRIERPPFELVELLSRAADVSRLTGGAFDVTVQPLWARYATHFSMPDADPAGPDVADVLPLIDWRGLEVSPEQVAFRRPGMAATLNGIAQGYITDCVAALLRRGGIKQVLLDLGEVRALGRHPDDRAWRVGIDDPSGSGSLAGSIELVDRAVATSGGYGTELDAAGRHTHLLDPRSGRTAPSGRSVSVLAPDATMADALSTGFSLMSADDVAAVVQRASGVEVLLMDGGALHRLHA